MKILFKIAFILFLTAAAGAQGRAETTQYKIKVGEFSKLKVVNDLRVKYVCNPDSAGYAVYTTEDRFADAIIFNNKGGMLNVSVHTDYVHLRGYLPVVTVYSSYLVSAENHSNFEMRIERPAPTAEISFKQVGNGGIYATDIRATTVKASIATGKGVVTLSGKADFANFDMVGTGKIEATELEANEVKCTVFGTGSIACWPLEKLTVKGMASTTIYYKGAPAAIKKSGIAKIEKLP